MPEKLKGSEIIIEKQKLFYWEKNNDPNSPITIFLHGWGSSAQAFSSLFPFHKNILAFDFPASGKSSPLQSAFTLEDYTRITQKFLEKKVKKNQKIVLVGHSFGGRVIARLIKDFPEIFTTEKVLKISYISVPFFREKTFKTEIIGRAVSLGKKIIPSFLQKKSVKIFHRIVGENDYFDLAENEIMKKTFQNIVGEEISEYLFLQKKFPEISVFWGEKDNIIPLSFAYKAKNILPQLSIFSISNAQHFPWVENREEFLNHWKIKIADIKS